MISSILNLLRVPEPKSNDLLAALDELPHGELAQRVAELKVARDVALLDGTPDDEIAVLEAEIATAVREQDRATLARAALEEKLASRREVETIEQLIDERDDLETQVETAVTVIREIPAAIDIVLELMDVIDGTQAAVHEFNKRLKHLNYEGDVVLPPLSREMPTIQLEAVRRFAAMIRGGLDLSPSSLM